VSTVSGVRVVFSGQYWPGANSLYIARAFGRCGAIVRMVNETAIWPGWETVRGRIARRGLRRPVIEPEWNAQLRDAVKQVDPDLVYITNADFCWPDTVREIRRSGRKVMCFYHVVLWRNRPGSRFSDNIDQFDLVATTRAWQESEFREAGAKAVQVVRFGFDPDVHRPVHLSPKARERYETNVVFIGTCERKRTSDLERLLSSRPELDLKIWGNLWQQLSHRSRVRRAWRGRSVLEEEIPVVYSGAKVALHWVGHEPDSTDPAMRKGDQHNSRTFQIAACGGAMLLAQRTDEHKRFFKEDEEAVFFDDVPELLEKLDFWLDPARDERRREIAKAARARCECEDYSYKPVVEAFLDHFGLPRERSAFAQASGKEGSEEAPAAR